MSDVPTARRIRARASPRDPLTMRFILDAPIQAGRGTGSGELDSGAPLARSLLSVDGVRKVRVTEETILVTRTPDSDWLTLKAPIAAAIRQVLDCTDRPLGETAPAQSADGEDAALLAAVTEVLDREANPAIASHDGHVRAERVENGKVYLRMSGGCQGCAASAATLRNGIETMLRCALPEIREIVDVTDHATGATPYYRGSAGQSPKFVRPVPDGVIGWGDGGVTVDAAYLAPRLGLKAEELRAGQLVGDIVTTTEKATEAGPMRVTVRSPERSWSAEILPDGTAREVPPSRPAPASPAKESSLADRVRRYLEALPAHKLPITYGGLARGLGMYMPGSIRKVTDALETTMREDAEGGRPFVAARVVGRGPELLPGRGFFELAAALGCAPRADESERDFHRRQLAAASLSD